MSTVTITELVNYTTDELVALQDTRRRYLTWLNKHYRTCSECLFSYCGSRQLEYVRDELISLDEVLYPKSTQTYGPDYYFSDTRENEFDSMSELYNELVADYLEPERETAATTWFAQETPDSLFNPREVTRAEVQAWSSETVYADLTAQETAQASLEALMAVGISAAEDSSTFEVPYDREATEANFRKHFRIWTTSSGQVGIYKTFIRNVTAEDFEAYCSVCKKGFVFPHTAKALVNVILHAHTHLPNSVISGDTETSTIYIDGTDSLPSPGEDKIADREYILRTAKWYADRKQYLTQYQQCSKHDADIADAYSEWAAALV